MTCDHPLRAKARRISGFLPAAVLTLLFPGFNIQAQSPRTVVTDAYGAIVRGDTTRKEIAIVMTGDEFADGGETIRQVLQQNNIPAAFFLTGKFYVNPQFKNLITGLKKDGHYLGAHSDQHLLYCDWIKRDSLLVTERQFKQDLDHNYTWMAKFGIGKKDAPYFLPPYEWYNETIARWTTDTGLRLINFSPGTRSTADYTYPDMGNRYWPSDRIYASILERETTDPHGLNGFILLVHIGTDPRRTDKFYNKLDSLVKELKTTGYSFVKLTDLLKQ